MNGEKEGEFIISEEKELKETVEEKMKVNESNLRKRNLNDPKKEQKNKVTENLSNNLPSNLPMKTPTKLARRLPKKLHDKANGINMFGGPLAAFPLKQAQALFINEFKLFIELANLRKKIMKLAKEIKQTETN